MKKKEINHRYFLVPNKKETLPSRLFPAIYTFNVVTINNRKVGKWKIWPKPNKAVTLYEEYHRLDDEFFWRNEIGPTAYFKE